MNKTLNKYLTTAAVACAAMILLPVTAMAQDYLMGDVNGDGEINILDVQATVSQALGAADETVEANVDENAQVDILDVQNMINTVLGEGGLVQTLLAEVPAGPAKQGAEQRLIAVSNDGLFAEGVVDPVDGTVELDLLVNTGWSLALLVDSGEGTETVGGTVEFPIGDTTSLTLPLGALSQGVDLDLGSLPFNAKVLAGRDLRDIIAGISTPPNTDDSNVNGLPDFIEPFLAEVAELAAQSGGEDTNGGNPTAKQNGPPDVDGLGQRVAGCISGVLPVVQDPSLADENANNIPDFVEPVLNCLESNLQAWMAENGITGPPTDSDGNGTPDFVDDVLDAAEAAVPEWLNSTGAPALVDENENGIPDFAEEHISLPELPSEVDGNGNGVPDFAEDEDGDGIPNIADDDVPGDSDGDGIPDVGDLDDDNDGLPDYADDVLD